MLNSTRWLGRRLPLVGRFIRFSAISFSLILPLLGAATVTTHLTIPLLFSMVAVAVTFHIYAYVLNDVIDLPIDCNQPLRAVDPLVRGIVHPRQALVIAGMQVPLALLFAACSGVGILTYAYLITAFLLILIYDLWGKRILFPPLTDFIQGLSWGALVLYGSATVSSRPSALTDMVFVFVVVFILMINGVHGSVRDLANDLHCGARTTALLLGAKPLSTEQLMIPPLLILYALVLQALLTTLLVLPLIYNWFAYPLITWSVIASLVLILSIVSLLLLLGSATLTGYPSRMIFFGKLYIIVSLSNLLLLFAPHLDPLFLTGILVVFVTPLYLTSKKVL